MSHHFEVFNHFFDHEVMNSGLVNSVIDFGET
mgnify:FL=1